MSKNLKNIGFVSLLIILTSVVYFPMLKSDFKALDDQVFIVENNRLKDFGNAQDVFVEGPLWQTEKFQNNIREAAAALEAQEK